jgi:hypothetical protein
MQILVVEHRPTDGETISRGKGVVVDRISNVTQDGFVVRLGVSYFDTDQPSVIYEDPDELACLDYLDSFSELDEEDGAGEEEEET